MARSSDGQILGLYTRAAGPRTINEAIAGHSSFRHKPNGRVSPTSPGTTQAFSARQALRESPVPRARARTFRNEYAVLAKRRDDTTRLTLAGADNGGSIRAGKLAAIEHRLKDGARFGRQLVEPGFFRRP